MCLMFGKDWWEFIQSNVPDGGEAPGLCSTSHTGAPLQKAVIYGDGSDPALNLQVWYFIYKSSITHSQYWHHCSTGSGNCTPRYTLTEHLISSALFLSGGDAASTCVRHCRELCRTAYLSHLSGHALLMLPIGRVEAPPSKPRRTFRDIGLAGLRRGIWPQEDLVCIGIFWHACVFSLLTFWTGRDTTRPAHNHFIEDC